MKILFVSSGNSEDFNISPIVLAQAESLRLAGIEIELFSIKGKGIIGYCKNIFPLRKHINNNTVDLIHAHYVLCAWVALLTLTKKPVVCSFMGSDTYGDINKHGKLKFSSITEIILAKIIQPFLSAIIVKSRNLYKYIWFKEKTLIIPNGVNLEIFKPNDKDQCRNTLKLIRSKKYILFLGDVSNNRKNFPLLLKAYKLLDWNNMEILNPYPVPAGIVPDYINAADAVILTSYLEGSPNIIKEAMACNCPIVATDVGDVKWIFGNTEGCYISSFSPKDVSNKIHQALEFGKPTNGRDRIRELGLDSSTIALRLIQLYKKILEQ